MRPGVAAFGGSDGAALATAFDETALAEPGLAVAPGDYAELFRTAISDRGAAAWAARRARAHLRPARSAAADRRPHGAGRLVEAPAAGGALRSWGSTGPCAMRST